MSKRHAVVIGFVVWLSLAGASDAQSIPEEREPISLGILVDAGGNMGPLISVAHEGIDIFLNTLQPDDEVFMMGFKESPIDVVDFTRDKDAVSRSFGRFVTSGTAVLYPTLDAALQKLQRQGRNERKVLLLVTVGLIQDADLGRSRDLIGRSRIVIHSVGMPVGSLSSSQADWAIMCERALKQFAAVSNGTYSVTTHDRGRMSDYSVKPAFEMIAGRIAAERVRPAESSDGGDAFSNLPAPAIEEFKKGVSAIARRSKNDPAAAHFKKAIELAPGYYEAHLQLGLELERRELPMDAIESVAHAASLRPSEHQPLSILGRLYVKTRQFQNAADTLLKIGPMAPLSSGDRYNLGVSFYELNNPSAAVEQLKLSISLAPRKDASAYLQLHDAFMKLREPVQGLAALDDYLRLFPGDPLHKEMTGRSIRVRSAIEYEHAQAALRNGDEAEAVSRLHAALRLTPDSFQAHMQLGLLMQKAGKRGEAIRSIEKAVRSNPSSAEARTRLGELYVDSREYRKAAEVLNASVKLAGATATTFFQLGSAHYGLDSLAAAEETFRRAIELDPDFDLPYLGLYNLYMRRKEHPKALESIETYLKKFPDAVDRDDIQALAQGLRLLLKR